MQTVAVTIPPGSKPGSSLRMQVEGREVDVTVPEDAQAGLTINVQVPAAAPAAAPAPVPPPKGRSFFSSNKVHPN